MKIIIFFPILGLLILFNSCSIDDIEPINQLTDLNVVTDEASAGALLNSIYQPFRDSRMQINLHYVGLSLLGTDITSTSASDFGYEGYESNNVQADNLGANTSYSFYYKIINSANFLIEQLEAGNAVGISDTRKNEMLAEAKTLRALSHFGLLRAFGQFYELNSALGIVIRTTPARSLELNARNTVQECYDTIISDLQFAAANGTNNVMHYYVSATTAQALLARVYLSMGDYTNAASAATLAINNGDGYTLEATYADAFNRWDSAESIFAPFAGNGGSESSITGTFYVPIFSKPSPTFIVFADEQDGVMDGDPFFTTGYDPRFTFGLNFVANGPFAHGKYPNKPLFGQDSNTLYYMRVAELHLILAEAEVRRGGDANLALTNLNIIRTRAGVPLKTFVDTATLLADIRAEKRLELYNETGEEWYDILRYDRLGDLSASSLKATLTTADKFILPIPRAALSGNEALVQNPGY